MAQPSDSAAELSAVFDGGTVAPGARHASDVHRARRAEALTLRLAGLTYEQVGERLGIGRHAAYELVQRALVKTENRNAEAERELEGHRLDRLQAALWSDAIKGDQKAIALVLKISERRSKLMGLDAPTQVNLSIGVRHELESALRELEDVVLGEVVSDEPAAD